jgi:hypothetical protein
VDVVRDLQQRVVRAAEGAARGTDTEVEHEIINGVFSLLPNVALAQAMHANLSAVGGIEYDADERRFAEVLRRSLPDDSPPLESAAAVKPFEVPLGARQGGGSTDVGDVSWAVPTVGLRVATWVPGTSSHSWQAVAAGGTSIGTKGMLVAAKSRAPPSTSYSILRSCRTRRPSSRSAAGPATGTFHSSGIARHRSTIAPTRAAVQIRRAHEQHARGRNVHHQVAARVRTAELEYLDGDTAERHGRTNGYGGYA